MVAFAAAIVTAALLAGLGAQKAVSGGEVKIGLLTSVSGPASVYYPSIKQVTQLAVEEINASGGVNGNKVVLITADTKTTPGIAATESRRLVFSEGVKLVVVEDIVADRDASIPFTTQGKVPFVYAWSYEGGPLAGGTADVCRRNFWATGQVPNNVIPQPIEYLMKTKGWKTWFLIGSDYKWPRTMNQQTIKIIKRNGGEVLGEEYVPLNESEFGALVTKLKGLPAGTAIVNNLVGGNIVSFFKQWNAAGGKNDRIITFGMDEQVLAAIGKAVAGTYGSYDYYPNRLTPGNKLFLKKLRARFGKDTVLPTSLSEEGYEAIWLWALAARKAKSFDLDPVNKAMLQVSFFGPRDRVKYLPNHHMALPNILAIAGPNGLYTTFVKDFGVIGPSEQCPASTYK